MQRALVFGALGAFAGALAHKVLVRPRRGQDVSREQLAAAVATGAVAALYDRLSRS